MTHGRSCCHAADRLTGHQAFTLLVRTCRETNLELADIARWLVTETEARAGQSPR